MTRTIKHQADDKRMTLGELRQFLAAVDGADGDTPVKVRVSFGGWLKSIEVVESD